MKKIVSLLLALSMVLLSLTGCIKVKSKTPEASVPSLQDGQVVTPTFKNTVVPAITAEPASTPEPAADPTPTAEPLPPENFADIDRDFFCEYLKTDITSLHQMVKDPAAFGIDYDSVERSLGTYKEDPDREWYVFMENTLARLDRVDQATLS